MKEKLFIRLNRRIKRFLLNLATKYIRHCTDKVLKRLKSEHPNVKIDIQGANIKLNTFEKIYSE